ncbi:GNAT family N-acetyltransferase [Fictibacillus nanhaiensis]|nr:GNAT family N-acetyltransferase [Fictibacillus nanhaiensis]
MFEYGSDEDVSRYVTWDTHKTTNDTKDFIEFVLSNYEKCEVAPWGIELKETGKLIGTVDFVSWSPHHNNAEIGYVLSRAYWGMGITTEAANELIRFGFDHMELVRIQSRCFIKNTGSERVMEKLGMTFEGIVRKGMFAKGKHQDLKLYSILKEEFTRLV